MLLFTVTVIIGGYICVGLIKFALTYLEAYRSLLRSKCFRGPKAYPLIGSSHLLWGTNCDVLKSLDAQMIKYESPFRGWIGHRLYFGVHDAEQIKLILSSADCLEKDDSYEKVKPMVGDGLLTASASIWKQQRKAIQPTFNLKILETYIPIFEKNAYILGNKFEMGGEFDINEYVSRYALDNISETTMGVSPKSLTNEDCPYIHHLRGLSNISSQRIFTPWYFVDFIFYRTPLGKAYKKSLKYLRNFVDTIVRNAKQNAGTEFDTQSRKSFLGLLFRSTEGGIKFDDKQIRDHVSTVIVTGSETTSHMLTLALFLLANHPDIQDKVYEELREVYGHRNPDKLNVTMQDLNSLEYLDRVLKETMRLFPAAPLLFRLLSHDINIGGYTLPAGHSVAIAFFSIHRSEKYWPRPLEFIPDRFQPDHPMGPRHPHAFIPFSAGPRNCIGIKYANILIKTALSILLRKYVIRTKKFQEPADVKLLAYVTMKLKEPIMLIAEKRTSITSQSL